MGENGRDTGWEGDGGDSGWDGSEERGRQREWQEAKRRKEGEAKSKWEATVRELHMTRQYTHIP